MWQLRMDPTKINGLLLKKWQFFCTDRIVIRETRNNNILKHYTEDIRNDPTVFLHK